MLVRGSRVIAGSLRRFQADSRAGLRAGIEKKPAVDYVQLDNGGLIYM
jgi:hypothetical protein